ncbi:MAG: adenylyl-sulfate kinase [Parvibaculaceae bacterium]
MGSQANKQPGLEPGRRWLVFAGGQAGIDSVRAVLPDGSPQDVSAFSIAHWHQDAWAFRHGVIPVIVLDAMEGIRPLDRYHAYLVRFLGMDRPLVVVGRMDEVGDEADQFDLIQEEYEDVLLAAGLHAERFVASPDNPREAGLGTLGVRPIPPRPEALRVRVTGSEADRNLWRVRGELLAGTPVPGDTILCSPSNRIAHAGQVTVSEDAPNRVTLLFESTFYADEDEILSHQAHAPQETDVFRARVHCTSGEIREDETVLCETPLGSFEALVETVELTLDLDAHTIGHAPVAGPGTLAEIVLRAPHLVVLDSGADGYGTGTITLRSLDGTLLGTGLTSMEGYADQRHLVTPKATNITPVQNAVSPEDRIARNGHAGGVLWFTGLSGAGKSTLAMALEKRLFEKGYAVFVLDGDNVRQGLTANLGFSPGDRAENIRRVGEVAALFRQAGMIAISSFISPYRSDRDRARHAAEDGFHEIYIKADVETCISRDPKGLYARALKGDIAEFTGISAPYEEPVAPDLVVDTQAYGIEACLERLVNYVDTKFRL